MQTSPRSTSTWLSEPFVFDLMNQRIVSEEAPCHASLRLRGLPYMSGTITKRWWRHSLPSLVPPSGTGEAPARRPGLFHGVELADTGSVMARPKGKLR